MLRQCIENNVDLIAIDNEYNNEYREALYGAQTTGNIESLVKVLEKCQVRLDEKLIEYESVINQVSGEID